MSRRINIFYRIHIPGLDGVSVPGLYNANVPDDVDNLGLAIIVSRSEYGSDRMVGAITIERTHPSFVKGGESRGRGAPVSEAVLQRRRRGSFVQVPGEVHVDRTENDLEDLAFAFRVNSHITKFKINLQAVELKSGRRSYER